MKKILLMLCWIAAMPLFGLNDLIAAVGEPQQSTVTITGTVKDDKGEPLIGANVLIVGTTSGQITDLNGNFTISSPADATLRVSFVGYLTQEVKLSASKRNYDIVLREDTETLDELVVIGYGSVKKSDVTGSLASVTSEEIVRKNPVTVTEGLQGAAAGVVVTRSGGPGGGASVRIRGIGSISNGFAPLYVVDGIRVGYNADYLNPNDIASVEILKDASATAIFGSQGANGVIIITTKQAEAGRARVNFTANYGVITPSEHLDVLNAEGYVKAARLAAAANGATVNATWAKYDKELTSIDWQDEMSRTALTQNYNMTIMGGSDATRAVFSVGYQNSEAVIINQEYERLTARLNIDNTIKKIIRIGGSLTYNYNQNRGSGASMLSYATLPPTMDDSDATGNIIHTPIRYPNGDWGHYPFSISGVNDINQYIDNPVAVSTDSWEAGNKNRINMVNATGYFELDIIKGLTFRTNVGFNAFGRGQVTYSPLNTRTYYKRQDDYDELTTTASMSVGYSVESYLTYNLGINDHSINAMLGYSASRSNIQVDASARARYFAVPTIRQIGQTQDTGTLYGSGGLSDESHMLSQFGRLNYSFKSKYLLTATMRRDGSSNFGKGNRWGYFPSAAVTWRIGEETFVKDAIPSISNLKLRLSWGRTGNSGFAGDLSIDQLSSERIAYYYYEGGSFSLAPGLAQTKEIDTNLKWETNETKNIGLDFGIMNNSLSFTVDWFVKDSKDLLTYRPIRPSAGYAGIYTNLGHIRNSGFEFSATYQKQLGQVFTTVRANATTLKNEAIDIGEPTVYTVGSGDWWTGAAILQNGYALGTFFGYRYDGIFRDQAEIDALNAQAAAKGVNGGYYQSMYTKPGDVKFKDLDGDGYVNMDDNSDREVLGNGFPTLTYGLNIQLNYKRWDATINTYGALGQKLLSYAYKNLTTMRSGTEGYQNIFREYYENSWTADNPTAKYPRLSRADDNRNTRVSDLYLFDGDYFKIRNVQIGYTFSSESIKRLSLDNVRLSLGVQDLYTFTKYPGGLDPEITQGFSGVTTNGIDEGRYPLPRTFTFALTVGF